MNIKKINRFLEQFWLVVGIATMIYGLYVVYMRGFEGNRNYLLFPLIALALWYMRMTMRKRLERSAADRDPS